MPFRLLHVLLGLCVCSWAHAAAPPRIESVEFSRDDTSLNFTFVADAPIEPAQLERMLDSGDKVVVLRVNGFSIKRKWLPLADRQISRTLQLPSKERPPGAVLRVRMKKRWKAKQVEAAKVSATGNRLTVRLPRDVATATAWLSEEDAPPPVAAAPIPVVLQPAAAAPPSAVVIAPGAFGPVSQVMFGEGVTPPPPLNIEPVDQAPVEEKSPTDPPPEEKPAEETPLDERPQTEDRVEGELAEVGSIGLIPWENRVGVVLGVERLGEIYYGQIEPELNYATPLFGDRLSMSFGVPLRIEIFDARADAGFDDAGRFRSEDWDQVSDYARVIQRIHFGGKESHFYLDINRLRPSSLGHGVLMKRYNPNLNFNVARVSMNFDAFSDFGGFESMLNDITGPNVFGALVFFKPLSFIDRSNYVLRSFSVGFTAVADVDAPLRNEVDLEDVDDDGKRETELAVDQNTFEPRYLGTEVFGYGIDVEVKVWDERALDWKVYTDYSFLESGIPLDRDGLVVEEELVATEAVRSGGFTLGNLFRLNLGEDPDVHAVRVRAEYRNYDPNYLPSYFDMLYEVQRIQYEPADDADGADNLANNTKLQEVLGRDPDRGRVNGGYFEASWRYSHYVALAMGLELNDQTPDDNLFLHAEVPHLHRWQFSLTYNRRNASNFADLFDFSLDGNNLMILQTRYGVVDWFHLTLEATTPFGIGPDSVFRNEVSLNLAAEFGFSY